MILKSLTPLLWVTSLELTLQYYTEVLGFSIVKTDPVRGWAEVKRDEVSLLFSLPGAHYPMMESKMTGTFSIRVSDVEGLWDSWKDKVAVEYPLDKSPDGLAEFCIRDCNGYLLQFGSPLVA